ncbi:hypothetical protein MPK64_gp280 [Erwinia phage pEa_SNUABM_16]|uniref:Uncharacterized protein n=1 Tax=Erwinia phage pEa_SNUABM_16 TaxID=2869544 RepID=A0AAE8XR32_9CAUD|nr:hypothetical protein MPK64_gp280 [Erwinia phage pEa_SNUABM_16]UAW96424.1 hypothetical protein pEaSNUABM16_00280 [Erwinia phage pEa_SNUABM_16]
MEKKFCKLAHIGADVIMPAILYALNEKMQAGVKVDLAEAYTLLNDTQAVYLTLASGQPDRYYDQLTPTIRALLEKYEIQWALDRDTLTKYCQSYMESKGFTPVEDGVYSYPEVVAYNNYDRVFLRSLIGVADYNLLEAAIQEEMDVVSEMDEIDKKLDRVEDGCCSECGKELEPDIEGPFMCLECDDDGE